MLFALSAIPEGPMVRMLMEVVTLAWGGVSMDGYLVMLCCALAFPLEVCTQSVRAAMVVDRAILYHI